MFYTNVSLNEEKMSMMNKKKGLIWWVKQELVSDQF